MLFELTRREGFSSELSTLIATWEDGTREWLGELGEPTLEAICWQPYPDAPSIGGLMLHMHRADIGWISGLALGEPRENDHPAAIYADALDVDGGKWPTPPAMPWDWYFNLLKEGRERVFAGICDLSDPTRVIASKANSFTLEWIVGHLVQHDSYHGGQCVMLHEMWKRAASPSRE